MSDWVTDDIQMQGGKQADQSTIGQVAECFDQWAMSAATSNSAAFDKDIVTTRLSTDLDAMDQDRETNLLIGTWGASLMMTINLNDHCSVIHVALRCSQT